MALNNSPYLDKPALSERERKLVDMLAIALPYVECAEDDPAYDKGAVRKVTSKMRALLRELGA